MSEREHGTRIQEYFDAELDTTARRQVEAHLSECRPCRQELAWLKLTARLIAEEQVPVDLTRLTEMRRELLNRYDALLSVKQPVADELKSRVWTNSAVRFTPRSLGRGEQWANMTSGEALAREAATESPALAREVEVELPARLKTARRQFAQREDE